MLFAFFNADGSLRRDAFTRQINVCIHHGAAGIAVLGLGTEVAKLGISERRAVVDWVMADVAGRVPVAVTVADGNVPDMIESARFARNAGAAWLILQPPRPPASGADLIRFFGAVADSVDCPVAIQNAPDFLGIGLTTDELLRLNAAHPNVSVVKAECSAVAVARVVDTVAGRMKVFNGRAGLELCDNYRAGVDGMIPGVESIDFQVAIEHAMRAGKDLEAEAHYRRILPYLSFAMQGLAQFMLYGKLIAAHRLGIDPSADRGPSDTASVQGRAWAKRFADELGALAG